MENDMQKKQTTLMQRPTSTRGAASTSTVSSTARYTPRSTARCIRRRSPSNTSAWPPPKNCCWWQDGEGRPRRGSGEKSSHSITQLLNYS